MRKNLRFAIRKSQKAIWSALIDSVKSDPWVRAYKIVTLNMGGTPLGAEAPEREKEIANGLFPSVTPPDWPEILFWSTSVVDPVPFSFDKLVVAASRLPPG